MSRGPSLKPLDAGPSRRNPLMLSRVVFGLVCLAFVVACPTRSEGPPSAPDVVTLQLKWKHQFQFAGYYAALDQGYYLDSGLDVRILEAPDDVEPSTVVLGGEADFGIAASDLVLLRAEGDPVVALAAIYQHSPLILLSLRGRGIDSVHDLAGRTAMIEPHAAELLAYLLTEGIPSSRLTLVPHTFDPQALITGEVDTMSAYSTDEPFLLRRAGADYQIFNPRAGGIDLYGDTLFTTEDQIRDHPERVEAFLGASLRGWDYALRHPAEIVDLILTQYSQRHSREHLLFEAEQTHRLILPDVVEIGYMNPGRWRFIADVYSEMGMVPRNVPLDGFLYDRNPTPELVWFYLSLLGVLGLLGMISLVAVRFYRLNSGLQHEISERVRTEASLRALERRYRTLVESAPFPIVITRRDDGAIFYVNPACEERFELDQDDVIGTSPVEFYDDPGDLESLAATWRRQGFLRDHEVKLKTASGRRFWASISANSTTFEDEAAIFYAVLDVTDRRELTSRLETMAMTDDLTGLANRRYFTRRGEEEFNRSRRYHQPMALLMLDADSFKDINDTFGHEAGDQVLRQVATILTQCLRDVDIPGRLGGDEFGVILPNTRMEDALVLAGRLRRTMARHKLEVRGQTVQFTMSFGAAEIDAETGSIDDLFRKADVALYRDKLRDRGTDAREPPDGAREK